MSDAKSQIFPTRIGAVRWRSQEGARRRPETIIRSAASVVTPSAVLMGALLARLRREAGMSQRDLAAAIQCGAAQIHALEIGRKPPGLAEFRAICMALQADPAAVFEHYTQDVAADWDRTRRDILDAWTLSA